MSFTAQTTSQEQFGNCFGTTDALDKEKLKYFYRNSGKDYNDFGRFKDCKEHPDFQYYLITCKQDRCGGKFPTSVSMGMCVPNECGEQELRKIIPVVLPRINDLAIPYEFSKIVEGGNAPLTLSMDELILVDSEQKNLEANAFGFSNFVVLFMIWGLMLAVVISTLVSWFRDKEAIKIKLEEEAKRIEETQRKSNPRNRDQSSQLGDSELYSTNIDKKPPPESTINAIVRAFSLQSTFRKLFSPSKFHLEDKELEIFKALKVYSIALIVFGNTFFYMFQGPLQNMKVIDSWPKGLMFILVLQSDLQVDVFYWITAFVWSFTLLKNIHQYKQEVSIWKNILYRYLRLSPLYYMTILFMWKFLSLQGGKGPRFYQFEKDHGCEETWFWHFIYLNNLFPWKQNSNCLQETWYLANDLQFFVLLCILVIFYSREKKNFYMMIFGFAAISLVFQLIVICANKMSASYLAYEDEYWTLYHFKPYSRIHGYLIGVWLGCEYHSYKYPSKVSSEDEEPKQSLIHSIFDGMKNHQQMMICYMCLGSLMQILMVLFHRWINMNPYTISEAWSVLYLLFCRPIYIMGLSLILLPILVQNSSTKPLRKFLGHEYWIPQARLCYGVFLCNSMFMQYRIYDSQHGLFVQMFDTYLIYLAMFTFAVIFSFLTYIVIEGPASTLIKDFCCKSKPIPEIKATLIEEDDQPKRKVRKVKKKKSVSINQDDSMEGLEEPDK